MKTLAISIELSSIAMETINQSLTPSQIMTKIKKRLAEKLEVMGNYLNTQLQMNRQFDDILALQEYQLTYENHTLQLEFLHFKPRDSWEVKGFKFV